MYTARHTEGPKGREFGLADPISGSATLADVAYRALKTRILRGEFPVNIRLAEARLAGELDVSRTPVREALRRLSGEGLVEAHPDGGFRPCLPDTEVMRELYEVRAALELQAISRPGRVGTVHDRAMLVSLRDQWRTLRVGPRPDADPDFVLVDESFHETLAMAAGNRVLVELLHSINERIRLIRMYDFLSEERIAATIDEHLVIVEQVLDGELVAAIAAFDAHLSGSLAVVEERALEALARMARGVRP